jgi:hypothetical protein
MNDQAVSSEWIRLYNPNYYRSARVLAQPWRDRVEMAIRRSGRGLTMMPCPRARDLMGTGGPLDPLPQDDEPGRRIAGADQFGIEYLLG